jgi:hypothetical protein
MAISHIASYEATGTSISVTANPGDLILLGIARDGSATAPTLVGEIHAVQIGTTSNWMGAFEYICVTANPTFSGFTNATRLVAAVYRSTTGKQLMATRGPTSSLGTAGAGGDINYAALAAQANLSEKWQVGMVYHRSNDVDIQNPPSGMTNRISSSGGTGKIALHDTDGTSLSWPLTAYTLTAGTSSTWRSHVVEIAEMEFVIPSGGAFLNKGMNGGLNA